MEKIYVVTYKNEFTNNEFVLNLGFGYFETLEEAKKVVKENMEDRGFEIENELNYGISFKKNNIKEVYIINEIGRN